MCTSFSHWWVGAMTARIRRYARYGYSLQMALKLTSQQDWCRGITYRSHLESQGADKVASSKLASCMLFAAIFFLPDNTNKRFFFINKAFPSLNYRL